MHPTVNEALVIPPGSANKQAQHFEARDPKKSGDGTKDLDLVISFSPSSDSALSLLGTTNAAASVGRHEKEDVDDDTITTASSASEADLNTKKQVQHLKQELHEDTDTEKSDSIFRSSNDVTPLTLVSDGDCSTDEIEGLLTLKRANPVYDSDDEDDYYYSAYASPSKRSRHNQEDEDKTTHHESQPLFYFDPELMWSTDSSKTTIPLFQSNQLPLMHSDEHSFVSTSSEEGSRTVPS